MNAYQIFKNEIDIVRDELDTFLYIMDKKTDTRKTVGHSVDSYIDLADRLKNAMEALKKEEGETRIADIEYEGKFRD